MKRTVYTAKKTAEEKKLSDLKPGMDDIFKIAKQLRKVNQDVVGNKCVKDDSGNLSFDNEAKKVAWKQHYERLLNEEFSWNPEDVTAVPVVGPPIHFDAEMVVKAITKMKTGKAAGPSGIVAEMLKASGDTGARLVADLANDMVRNGVIPPDWEDSFIINIYKGKGDALERGNYRGLKLLDHVMKLLRTRNCTSHLLTLKRRSIAYQEKSSGGPCENLAERNGLCDSCRLCTTTPEAELESITPTVMNLESKLEFTRVRYSALSYSSLYSKLCLVSSALGHPGSCCMLMT